MTHTSDSVCDAQLELAWLLPRNTQHLTRLSLWCTVPGEGLGWTHSWHGVPGESTLEFREHHRFQDVSWRTQLEQAWNCHDTLGAWHASASSKTCCDMACMMRVSGGPTFGKGVQDRDWYAQLEMTEIASNSNGVSLALTRLCLRGWILSDRQLHHRPSVSHALLPLVSLTQPCVFFSIYSDHRLRDDIIIYISTLRSDVVGNMYNIWLCSFFYSMSLNNSHVTSYEVHIFIFAFFPWLGEWKLVLLCTLLK